MSKQMGSEISRLITLAQRVKSKERGTDGEADKGPVPGSYMAIAKEMRELRNHAKELERALDVTRRAKLANFSTEDIEKELVRRLDMKFGK
jgi:hypothetical protein